MRNGVNFRYASVGRDHTGCLTTVMRRFKVWARPLARYVGLILYRVGYTLLRRTRPEWNSRWWSNAELRRYGHLFSGDVINVSASKDEDKQGGHYADYFPNKTSYTVSNAPRPRGVSALPNEIILDLRDPIPDNLKRKYAVVLNHSTLEHIFDVRQAMRNLCELSDDIVILVVPFSHPVHWVDGDGVYRDYWRLSPFALKELFEENEFVICHCSNNSNPVFNTYLFCIATRPPEKWRGRFHPPVFSVPRNFAECR